MFNSSSKTKILDNTFLDFNQVVSMSINEFVFLKDDKTLLKGYRVTGKTDAGLEFDLFEDVDSATDMRCIKFIEDNWKKGKQIGTSSSRTWIDFEKIIATKISANYELSTSEPVILNYVGRLLAINSFGLSWTIAEYIRPKGIDNTLDELEKIRLKLPK